MTIANINSLPKKYACKRLVMEYLVYTHKLPILGFDKKYFYFADTDELRACLEEMPIWLKIEAFFGR